MAKCFFCGKDAEQGIGIMFVNTEGKVLNFCSSKCRKAFKLKRNPKKLKWIRKKK